MKNDHYTELKMEKYVLNIKVVQEHNVHKVTLIQGIQAQIIIGSNKGGSNLTRKLLLAELKDPLNSKSQQL